MQKTLLDKKVKCLVCYRKILRTERDVGVKLICSMCIERFKIHSHLKLEKKHFWSIQQILFLKRSGYSTKEIARMKKRTVRTVYKLAESCNQAVEKNLFSGTYITCKTCFKRDRATSKNKQFCSTDCWNEYRRYKRRKIV